MPTLKGIQRKIAARRTVPGTTVERVFRAACNAYCISERELLGPCRAGRVGSARRAVSLVLHERGFSYPMIAQALLRDDHTTALSAVRTAKKQEAESIFVRRLHDLVRAA